jgi:YD repeat-containing protein
VCWQCFFNNLLDLSAHPHAARYDFITYPGGSTVGFTYDDRGRRTSVTDQNSYTYDDADRLITLTDAANNATHYAYDTENNLSSIADANGHTTSFEYNPLGNSRPTSEARDWVGMSASGHRSRCYSAGS